MVSQPSANHTCQPSTVLPMSLGPLSFDRNVRSQSIPSGAVHPQKRKPVLGNGPKTSHRGTGAQRRGKSLFVLFTIVSVPLCLREIECRPYSTRPKSRANNRSRTTKSTIGTETLALDVSIEFASGGFRIGRYERKCVASFIQLLILSWQLCFAHV